MIVPVAVDVKYRQSRVALLEVESRVRGLITQHLEGTGYAFIGRQKQSDSLAEKIETGRYRSWDELDDLYACTIVVPTTSVEPQILDFLRTAFREVQVRRRGSTQKDPGVFRFDSTRFIGTLRPGSGVEYPEAISKQRFEVQVRTAFEHAWAVATHSLVYKGEKIEWRRLRLIAQLKAATEQLDHLIGGFDKVAELIDEESWPEVVGKRRIESIFRTSFEVGDIPADCMPASWVRFSENVYSLVQGALGRRLPQEALDRALNSIQEAIRRHRGDAFPRSVSLVQFAIGALVTDKIIGDSLERYCPMITEQLVSVFPATARINARFDFQLLGV